VSRRDWIFKPDWQYYQSTRFYRNRPIDSGQPPWVVTEQYAREQNCSGGAATNPSELASHASGIMYIGGNKTMDMPFGADDLVRDDVAEPERFFGPISACSVMVKKLHQRHHRGNLYRVRIGPAVPAREIVVDRGPPEDCTHKCFDIATADAFDKARPRGVTEPFYAACSSGGTSSSIVVRRMSRTAVSG
jgi:hypothetical protein